MKQFLSALLCLLSFWAQAQNQANTNSIWGEGSQWDVYYTIEGDSSSALQNDIKVTYRLLHANDSCMALEKSVTINDVIASTQIQGFIRCDGDTLIYVRPVKEDGNIGEECLLYDFRSPFEYGNKIRYGVMGGEVKELFINWQEDSLDYYMLNNGNTHCFPGWKSIIYKYGYIGGPMDLFLLEATPGRTNHPKPTNISHVIFSSKGGRKKTLMNGDENDDIIIPYDEMLTSGTTWEFLAVSADSPNDKCTYSIQVKGDTVIGTRDCKLIYSPEYNIQKTMFEEGRKVYVVDSNEENPRVLFDFNLQEGDYLPNEESFVGFIETQENQGYYNRAIHIDTGLDCHSYFAGDTEPWSYYLIESIGASKDQHLKFHFVGKENTLSYLMRCWKQGNLVYQAPGYETVSINDIYTSNKPLEIYDLHGRRLNSIPENGIYILGNKLMISKP